MTRFRAAITIMAEPRRILRGLIAVILAALATVILFLFLLGAI